MNTTTISDFTVKYKIPGRLYEDFLRDDYKNLKAHFEEESGHKMTPIMVFEQFLREGIEGKLRAVD